MGLACLPRAIERRKRKPTERTGSWFLVSKRARRKMEKAKEARRRATRADMQEGREEGGRYQRY